MDWTVLTPLLIEHAALPLLAAFGGWVLTKVPGPLRQWLESGTHAHDMALLLGAAARGAVQAYADYEAGRIKSPSAAIGQVVAYVLRTVPETVRKLGPTEATLTTIAHAAWDQWVVARKAAEGSGIFGSGWLQGSAETTTPPPAVTDLLARQAR